MTPGGAAYYNLMMRDPLDLGAETWSHGISRAFQRAEASLDWVAIPWDPSSGRKLKREEGFRSPRYPRSVRNWPLQCACRELTLDRWTQAGAVCTSLASFRLWIDSQTHPSFGYGPNARTHGAVCGWQAAVAAGPSPQVRGQAGQPRTAGSQAEPQEHWLPPRWWSPCSADLGHALCCQVSASCSGAGRGKGH